MSAPSNATSRLGFGIGWRPELHQLIEGEPDLFVEVIAENVEPDHLPVALRDLLDRDRVVIPHGIRLSLGGADRPDARRLDHLARLADRVRAPLVSEHIAFARAHGIEAGHVLPVARSSEALDIISENVALAQQRLPVPLALEHVAALVQWPDPEMSEAAFIRELLDRTGTLLLLDVSNLYANAVNFGGDPIEALKALPLDRIAYVHVGGGIMRDGRYHDTHTDPVVPEVLDLLEQLCVLCDPPGILLERDDNFRSLEETRSELRAIELAASRGAQRRAILAR